MKRTIDSVIDNQDKYHTYTELNKRRKKALEEGNYIEVVAYDYAMIEDRLLSILKHLKLIELNKKKQRYFIKKELEKAFFEFYYSKEEKGKKRNGPEIKNISTKIKIILLLLEYKKENESLKNMSFILKNVNEEIDLNKEKNILSKWCSKRDEIIHAMYNKNIQDFDKKIKDIAIEGKNISYTYSKISRIVKKYLKLTSNK